MLFTRDVFWSPRLEVGVPWSKGLEHQIQVLGLSFVACHGLAVKSSGVSDQQSLSPSLDARVLKQDTYHDASPPDGTYI